jgi:hypothetical protein
VFAENPESVAVYSSPVFTVVALRVIVGFEGCREVIAKGAEYPTESPMTKAIKPTAKIRVETILFP